MKHPSLNFDCEKQQTIKPVLTTNASSKDQKDPTRAASAPSESGHSRRQPSLRRNRLSNRNSNEGSVAQASRTQNVPDEVPGLADLIWKYFEPEIREALLETQQSLGGDNEKRTEQLSSGRQGGK